MSRAKASRGNVPPEVRDWAEAEIARFNQQEIANPECGYAPRWSGRFLYLDRVEYGQQHQVCLLTYTGDKDAWEFAIYKYSRDRYDPEEWLFPGAEHVDGTIAGAMRAGLEAYPIQQPVQTRDALKLMLRLLGRRH